jgi:hypothetical protein
MPASIPYINAIELDIVPAEFETFKTAILENAAASVPLCEVRAVA